MKDSWGSHRHMRVCCRVREKVDKKETNKVMNEIYLIYGHKRV